ncbi:MAG: tryptophan synthase subunit alpha [Phycisphaerales bacterium]|jgi:tryptophan synthase alpha chain
MHAHEAISKAITDGRDAHGIALVAYVTAGYPSMEAFPAILNDACQHADVVEVGIPFSNPIADGGSLQETARAALAAGATMKKIMHTLRDLDGTLAAPLLLMGYLNPLLAYGLDRLAEDASSAGVRGVIVPDLPLEALDIAKPLNDAGLATIGMVSPVTSDARLARIAAHASGFVYAVTSVGVTGQHRSDQSDIVEYLKKVKATATIPVCAGFGIREKAHVDALRGACDGVIVGSALMEAVGEGRDVGSILQALR